ncbi:MAG: diguanylate cyclase domain-containing protein [Candidatus Planktophila sp.]
MARLVRLLLGVGLLGEITWRLLSPTQSATRDVLLYNCIWALAIFLLFLAPLSLDRVALSALAIAIFLWGIGSLATSIDQISANSPRFTTLSQVLYALFYPLLIIAITRFTGSSHRLRPIELLDATIFGLGFTSIASSILLTIIFPGGSGLRADNFFAIFYPVGDLGILLILVMALITRPADISMVTLALGITVFTASDIYYLWLASNKRYSFGSIADDGWLVAIALIALSTSLHKKSRDEIKPIHPALVALSIFISPILLAISALRPTLFPIYIVIPSIANLLLAFIRMSTALREARTLASERALARTDELTGLANRRKLLSEIENFSEVEGALLLLDLDGFKPVNDQFGHETGDLLLREVARRFSRTLPEGALLARLGGDEFGVLVPGRAAETLEAAYALRASLSYPCTINGQSITVGVSIGHVHNDRAGNLLKRADQAMYRAKQMGIGVAQP